MGPIVDAFACLVHDHPERPALWSRFEGLRLTFGELGERVAEWERRLAPLSPEPMALATGNCAAFAELFLALRRLGRVVVAMDGTLPLSARVELCRRLGIAWLLHREPEAGEAGAPAGQHGETTLLGGEVRLLRLAGVEPAAAPAGTALVKLTSGSTGEPVGVCLSEEALREGIAHIVEGMSILPSDRVLISIPLSHSYGFDNGVLSLAVHGTPLVIVRRFFPAPLIEALTAGEVTFFPTVPPLVRALAEVDWPEGLPLRTVICAGAALPVETAQRFRQRSGRWVHQFYGSTESGGISFEADPADPAAEGTVGRPLAGVRVCLGEAGTVTVHSAANFGGYWGRDRELSPRTVTTGDTAQLGPDGRLRLTGRTAEIINVGGRKIAAATLEAALRGATGVEELAVVGVDDPVRGDRLVAFLVANGRRVDVSALPSGLQRSEVRLVQNLPYTERGKLDRQLLREWARSRG
jgi:acyl-CoA synthetase (AMP-forming)/AMP-acid ligase II